MLWLLVAVFLFLSCFPIEKMQLYFCWDCCGFRMWKCFTVYLFDLWPGLKPVDIKHELWHLFFLPSSFSSLFHFLNISFFFLSISHSHISAFSHLFVTPSVNFEGVWDEEWPLCIFHGVVVVVFLSLYFAPKLHFIIHSHFRKEPLEDFGGDFDTTFDRDSIFVFTKLFSFELFSLSRFLFPAIFKPFFSQPFKIINFC